MTKLEFINNQHDYIQKTIQNIEDVIINRQSSTFETKESLNNLLVYFKIHFYTEELLMSGDPINTKHKIDHNVVISFIEDALKKEHIEVESILFLKKWGEEHYTNFDKLLLENI